MMGMSDRERIESAYATAKAMLLAERVAGHWVGELSTSALSTATAVSALALAVRHSHEDAAAIRPLISGGARYLVARQNADGGWGDTDRSYSNIATTYLALAALKLAGSDMISPDVVHRAEDYLARRGGFQSLRDRYGVDKTFVVPILTNCALAGLVPWSEVEPLPFEMACVPQSWYRWVGMPVVSYAIPALIAIGQVNFRLRPPRNPIVYGVRAASVDRSLQVLRAMQPTSGGYLEAVPLTSFVVMSLAAGGQAGHAVTREGIRFLQDSVRWHDAEKSLASWPIDTNLATWVTTLSLNALASGDEDITTLADLDWLLACQHLQRHPFTGADAGGWGWSDLSGAVPDADDTPGAMLALVAWWQSPLCRAGDRAMIEQALRSGVRWLLGLQNRDGGWPTFCRGWGRLPFDRSGVDLTAHVIRALLAVYGPDVWSATGGERGMIRRAMTRGFDYIERQQRDDGSWIPLWFGNQDHPAEENPVYGTAKTIFAYRDAGFMKKRPAARGIAWLLANQNRNGSFGGGPAVNSGTGKPPAEGATGTIEETALAVEALHALQTTSADSNALRRGVAWLCDAVENDGMRNAAPVGLYFAKLWYYERLYPLTFTLAALGRFRRERAAGSA